MGKWKFLSLRWEISAVLLFKLAAVLLLHHLYFSDPVVATEAEWLAPVAPPSHKETP